MQTAKVAGRTIGVLLLLQIAGGFLANFGLMQPVFAPPGFLVNASAHPTQVGIAVLVGLATGAVSLGIAITAWPIFRRCSEQMALWYLALVLANFALLAVENTTLLSLLSLSQAYAKTAAADAVLFEALRGVVAASRNWAHYVNLIVAGGTLLVFYSTLYRFALVPRILAGLGILGALLQLTTVTRPLFGYPVIFELLTPLGLCHLALAAWLIARGFRDNAAKA